jgi:hypothetical protein
VQFPRLRAEPAQFIDFFEEGLTSLGAVCERPWHDRLEVLAEGTAAPLWNPAGELVACELSFLPAGSSEARDPHREIFPGSPLTFHLVEALWSRNARRFRVCLSGPAGPAPPDSAVGEKLWNAQYGVAEPWRTGAMRESFHFSVVAAVRCEIQGMDQSWTFHRLAFSASSGERDVALETSLEIYPQWVPSDAPEWPGVPETTMADWVGHALDQELAPELSAIKSRQERSLRRELSRIAQYFSHYEEELRQRLARQRSPEALQRSQQRIEATRQEHERRRADQIQRHAVRVIPQLDGLLTVAEPAFETTVHMRRGRDEITSEALYVPRTRRWFRR